jgi:hypothetical protein
MIPDEPKHQENKNVKKSKKVPNLSNNLQRTCDK